MDEKKTGRGTGKDEALTHVNLRLPPAVIGFYKQSPNYTNRMREILTDFAYGDIDYTKK